MSVNYNKLPRDNAKHIKINEPKIEPMQHFEFLENIENPMSSIVRSLYANVVDMTDNAICEAVISFAKEQGATDLYLLDRDFVKSALIHEAQLRSPTHQCAERKRPPTNFDKITEDEETFVKWVLDNYHSVPEHFPCQTSCNNDCGECFKQWLQKEADNV